LYKTNKITIFALSLKVNDADLKTAKFFVKKEKR